MSRLFTPLAALLATLALQAGVASAQSPAGPQRNDPVVRAKAQQQWDRYRENVGRAGAAEMLQQVLSTAALTPTKENVAAILTLLRTNINTEEKVGLIRLAGSLVPELDDQKSRADILSILSTLAMNTQDPVLGRAAALTYSRTGFYQDSLAVLAHAHGRGYIGDNDYFGDLAHLLPAAPDATNQASILSILAQAGNGFSREVLASLFIDRRVVDSLAPPSISAAQRLLSGSEPTLSNGTSTISGVDVLRYAYWLNAVVGLTAKATGETEPAVMARLLKVDGANPKTLISALNYEPNVRLIRAGLDPQAVQKIDASIAAFAVKSKNGWLRELADQARANLMARN